MTPAWLRPWEAWVVEQERYVPALQDLVNPRDPSLCACVPECPACAEDEARGVSR